MSPRAYLNGRGEVGDLTEVSVVIGNTAPEALAVAIPPAEPGTDEDLVAAAQGADLDGDALTWRYQWLRDGAEVAGATDATLPASETEHGQVWTVRAWASDGESESEPVEASVSIANAAPLGEAVTLAPDPAYEDSTIVASATGSDPDGDPLTWTYTWLVDGSAVPGVTSDSLTGEHFGRGQSVVVSATPNDGFIDGAPVQSDPVVIANTGPTSTGGRIEPADAREGDVLTCVGEGFSDLDGDAAGWVVVWTVNGSIVHEGPTLPSTYFDRDDVVGCAIAPFDGELMGRAVTAEPITIQNTPPVLASATLDPSVIREADTVRVVLGAATDADDDRVTFRYRWLVDGSAAGSDPTLTGAAFDRGQVVSVEVTPTDGTDDGVPVVSAGITVSNTAPVVTSVSLAPSSPRTADDLVASVTSSDDDGDGVTLSYAWYIDGVLASAYTTDTLPAAAFDKGQSIYVVVTPSDGTDSGDSVTSASVTVVNTAPSITSVSTTPSTVREKTVVTCTPSGFVDDDGDSPSYTFAWTVNGSPAGSSATLDGSAFDKGDELVCTVTPSDGTEDGEPVSSAAVTVANTAPVATSVTLSDLTPSTTDSLTATVAGVGDDDGDSVSLEYVWSVDSTAVRRVTRAGLTDTLDASAYAKGDTVQVAVTPTDGDDRGTTIVSGTATVQNTLPVVTALALSPDPAYTTTPLTATPTASDADGDSLSYLYAWFVQDEGSGGFVRQSTTSSVLSASLFDKDDKVYAEVTALDGDGSSAAFRSATLTIANSRPTAPSTIALTPTSPKPSNALTCTTTGGSDIDGDAIQYRFQWYRDRRLYRTAYNTSGSDSVPASATRPGEVWECQVGVWDGAAISSELSRSVTIGNAATCNELYGYGYGTGTYTLTTPSGTTSSFYCEMRSDGGWTRLYAADYRSAGCPSGWTKSSVYGGACIVNGPAIRSTTIDNHGIAYSQVRMNVGISQFSSMDAVGSASGRSTSLTGYYVDGFGLIYNDAGTWRDVFTVALGLGPGNGANSCGGASPPLPLRYFSCRTMWSGSGWSASWSGGFQWNGYVQYPLGRTTTGAPVARMIANQSTGDEDMAVRHMYLLIK